MNRITLVVLFILMVGIGSGALAQPLPSEPEARFQQLAQELKLTDSQKYKVLLRMQAEERQVAAIRTNATLADSSKDSRISAAHRAALNDIRELLTPAQQARLAAMSHPVTTAEARNNH